MNLPKLIRKGFLRSERRRDGALRRADVESLAQQRQAERPARKAKQPAHQRIDYRPDQEHEWLRPSKVAELVGVTPQAIAKRVRRGTLPGQTKGGRWWVRYDHLELVERARLQRTRRP